MLPDKTRWTLECKLERLRGHLRQLRQTIVALDKQFVWHPYTEMGSWIRDARPLVIQQGTGQSPI